MTLKAIKPPRKKRCKACKGKFTPVRQMQCVCNNWQCAADHANNLRIKREASEAKRVRKETKQKIEAAKPLSWWLKIVERYCNRVVKLRDFDQPCISCGTFKPTIKYDAGHYRTVKAAPHLRFNLDNIHKQCSNNCNVHLSGNTFHYRPRLIKKIGIERFEAIENNNEIHRYTIDECKELIVKFKAMIKELEQQQKAAA